MKIKNCNLDLLMLLSTVEAETPLFLSLSLALNSVAKRSEYGDLHYHEFLKCTDDDKIGLERAGLIFRAAGNSHSNRTYYEAHIAAFVQNLHAVCDSFPYVVFLMLGPLTYLHGGEVKTLSNESQYGWSAKFYEAVVHTFPSHVKLHRKLKIFMNDKHFLMLKGLGNQNKHQYLGRILNNVSHLSLEKITYWSNAKQSKKIIVHDIDVNDFMRSCHNKLFPKLFILFWTLHKSRMTKLSETMINPAAHTEG